MELVRVNLAASFVYLKNMFHSSHLEEMQSVPVFLYIHCVQPPLPPTLLILHTALGK